MQVQTSPSLRELFDIVVDLPLPARAGWLDAHCRDAHLRGQLERLLIADAEPEDLPVGGARAAAAAIGETEHAESLPPGSRIGPFELVAVLGEGGTSTVFHARREVEGVREEVALKLLRRGVYSPDAKRQFRRERQALAQLRHPGIARLIEGGISDSGLAYIALELVDGKPIVDHARERRLGLRERLGVFLQVCRAVEAAHRALIVHRDLKPSNVLVTGDGQVKLLDFGIAKLLDRDDETRTGTAAFTPAYAAPEQRFGGLVTTATDVYALGVLLGELVAGQRLSGGSGRTPSSQISGAEAPGVLPAPPPVTRRALRGDLDNIVLKAIALEPERRYASAGALADDIERMLAGRPVAAHPPSRWYRASKFVQRHRGGVIATALVVLAFVVAFAIAVVEGRVARREADRANAMRDFMFSAFTEAEPSVPRDGAPRITEVVEQAIAKARGDTQMNAAVRTELLTELGMVLRERGRVGAAREAMQWNYDQARRAFGDDDRLTVAAGRELARCLMLSGEFDRTREQLDALIAHTAAPADRARHAQLLMDSAELATKQHDAARAVRDGEEGLRLARAGEDDEVAYALSTMGNVRLSANDLAGAAEIYRELLARDERLYGPRHAKLATVHAAQSRVLRRLGDLDGAEREIRAALEIDAQVLPKDDWRHANHLNALTMVLRAKREFPAALESATEGLRINRIAFGDDHPEVANDLSNIGTIELRLENYPAAAKAFRAALDFAEARYGAERYETAVYRVNYGFALAYATDRSAGEVELRRAVAAMESAAKADPEDIAGAYEKLTRLQLDHDDARAALPSLDRLDAALARLAKRPPSWSGRSALLHGAVLAELHDPAALDRLRDASLIDKTADADPQLQVEASLRLAAAAIAAHDGETARAAAGDGLSRLAALRNPPPSLLRLADAIRSQLTIP